MKTQTADVKQMDLDPFRFHTYIDSKITFTHGRLHLAYTKNSETRAEKGVTESEKLGQVKKGCGENE